MRLPNPFGWGIPKVEDDELFDAIEGAVTQMRSEMEIAKAAGTQISEMGDTPDGGYTQFLSGVVTDVVHHGSTDYQIAHNRLNAIKPRSRELRSVHRSAMKASRAYGETMIAAVKYHHAFLGEPMDMSEKTLIVRIDSRELLGSALVAVAAADWQAATG